MMWRSLSKDNPAGSGTDSSLKLLRLSNVINVWTHASQSVEKRFVSK